MAYSFSRFSHTGMAATVAMHAAFGWALLRFDDAPPDTTAALPVMVSLVDSPGDEARAPVRPKPEVPEPQSRIEEITKPEPRVSDVIEPSAPARTLSEPSPSKEVVASASPGPVTDETPPASSITLPRFNADYLKNPPPVYPALSRRLGEQGHVMLRALVRADGLPETIAIHHSSGSSRLDRAALEAVRRWRFVPARRGDTPVAAPVLIPISFILQG